MRRSATFACAVGVLLAATGTKAHAWHKPRYYYPGVPVAPVAGAAFVPAAGFTTSAFVPSAGFTTSALVPSAGFTTMSLVPSASFGASAYGCQGGAAGAGTAQTAGIDPIRLLEIGLPFIEKLINRPPSSPFGGIDPSVSTRLSFLETRVLTLEQKVAAIEAHLGTNPTPGIRPRPRRPLSDQGPFGQQGIGAASAGGNAGQLPSARQLLQTTKVIDAAIDQVQDDFLHLRDLHAKSPRKGSNSWKRNEDALNQVKAWLKTRGTPTE